MASRWGPDSAEAIAFGLPAASLLLVARTPSGPDVCDPLTAALSGLLAQLTDIWACMATVGGPLARPDVADRPIHHEIALVELRSWRAVVWSANLRPVR